MQKKLRSVTEHMTTTRHLETGNRVIKTLNTLMFTVLAGATIFICFLFCLKPWQRLCEMEEKLLDTQKVKEKAFLLKEQKEKELEWLITDPAYFEMVVRDKMDMSREGETIVRVDRSPEDGAESPPARENSREFSEKNRNKPGREAGEASPAKPDRNKRR